MRISILLAILGGAALSAPAFAAADTVTSDAGRTAMAAQTVPDQRQALRSGDVDDVVGNYDLSHGQTLRVSFSRHKLFAEMGSSKTEIMPAGERTFASANGDLKLVFDRLPFATSVAVTRK
jgi:hypothetical protein